MEDDEQVVHDGCFTLVRKKEKRKKCSTLELHRNPALDAIMQDVSYAPPHFGTGIK